VFKGISRRNSFKYFYYFYNPQPYKVKAVLSKMSVEGNSVFRGKRS